MKRPESEVKFFECSCSSELVAVEKYDDEPEIYMSIYYRGVPRPMGWKDKLRYCWRILTQGSPYGDQVVFNKETATELADHIHVISNR